MSSVSRRIQLRRDTADNWTSINPILAQGEIGYETTGFKRMKVGDGVTRWAALSYFNIGPTGRLGTTGPVGPAGSATNTGATGPTGVPGLSGGVTFQLNHTSAGPIVYSTVVSTLAGSSQGILNEPGTAARFFNPSGTAVDTSGNVYVADAGNNVIRKITPVGVVSTFAGDGAPGSKDGTGSGAQFNGPSAIVINSSGTLFVSDAGNHCIRRITSAGVVSTFAGGVSGFADGIGINAQFNSPQGIVVDSLGNVFVADSGNHRIRSITPAGQVSTLAGQSLSGTTDDLGTLAKFNTPTGLAIDSLRNLYVTDKNNHRIRKVTAQGGVSTLAGSTSGFINDTGVAAQFNSPVGITIDSTGTLYVADTGNHRIRTVTSTGVVTTLVGLSGSGNSNGSPSQAQFNSPYSITVGTTGVFYVADYSNHLIRKIIITASDPNEYVFTPFTGTLITPLNTIATTSSYIVVPQRKTNTHIATFTIPLLSMPATTSIFGQWMLGLNSSVAISSTPASFYFEVLDGTTSVAVGQATSVAQTSSGVILSTLTVPARTYTSNLTLKLFATTRDLSPLTFRFNGTTLSYLNTTIINVGPTGPTGPHLFTIFNKLDHRVITSLTDKSDELFANSNLTFNGSNLNVVNTVTTSNFRGQGTVAAPPYAFTTDVTSGMFLPAVSNLALATTGTERIRILSNGNVGIATPTPGFTLDVSGTANISGNLSVGTISTSGGGFSVPGNLTGAIIRTSSNGTAGVPAYTFLNDLSSGMFLPFPNTLAWATAGNERMRLSATGRLGIGNQDPLTTLDVNGTARITSTLSAGATTVTSLNAGSGAITTTGALSAGSLDAGSGAISTTGALSAGSAAITNTLSAGATTVASLAAGSGAISTTGTLSAGATTVASLNSGGNISNAGSLTSGAANVSSLDAGAGNITTTGNVFVNRVVSSGYGSAAEPVIGFEEMNIKDGIFRPGAASLGFSTAGNERMRLSSAGRLGIGNQDPLHTLDVTGSARITSTLSAGATTVTSLNASSGAITTTGALSAGAITTTGTASVNRLIGTDFGTAAVPAIGFEEFVTGTIYSREGIFKPARGALGISAFGVERMRVSSNGVGIGRPDPSNALDVSGTVRITGTLSAGATTVASLNASSGAITTTGALTAGSLNSGGNISNAGSLTTGSLNSGGNISNAGSLTTGSITTTGAISAASASITDVSLNTINGSKYSGGGSSGRTFKLNYSGTPTTTVSVFAGTNGSSGTANGGVGVGRFSNPTSMAVDSTGAVYVVDGNFNKLRKVSSSGVISDFVNISGIAGLCVDNSDNIFACKGNQIIKITSLGVDSVFAGQTTAGYGDGTGASIFFNNLARITVDSAGTLYVTEVSGNRVRKINSSGVSSTLAGSTAATAGTSGSTDGVGTLARFSSPIGIGLDSAGNVYVGDGNHLVRKITPSGNVSTLAGRVGVNGTSNGTGTEATFSFLLESAEVDRDDNVYIADRFHSLVRKIDKYGVVSTFTSGNGLTSRLAIQRNTSDTLYVSDELAHIIRKITTTRDSTYAGTLLTGTLDTDFNTQLTTSYVTIPAFVNNAKVMSFSLPSTSPSSILGQWILGLYASVVLPASPASFYFQIMDGSTSVAIGSTSPTSINLSTPLQVYTSSLLVPARAYGALTLNLYVTTQASSALTIGFNGLNLSYLSTSIQLGATTVTSLNAGSATVTSLAATNFEYIVPSGRLNSLSLQTLGYSVGSTPSSGILDTFVPLFYSVSSVTTPINFRQFVLYGNQSGGGGYVVAPKCRLQLFNLSASNILDITNDTTIWKHFFETNHLVTTNDRYYLLYPI
jgi:sugar lactone lactonase YvrE